MIKQVKILIMIVSIVSEKCGGVHLMMPLWDIRPTRKSSKNMKSFSISAKRRKLMQMRESRVVISHKILHYLSLKRSPDATIKIKTFPERLSVKSVMVKE